MKVSIAKTAFLMSLCLHMLALIALSLLPHKTAKEEIDTTLEVDIDTTDEIKIKVLNPRIAIRPLEERIMAYQEFSFVSNASSRHLQSDSKINEVLKIAPVNLKESAAKSEDSPKTEIMLEIDTTARLKNPSDFDLPVALSTPTTISPAKGVKSTRQVVAGKGSGGLGSSRVFGAINTHGISDRVTENQILDITNKAGGENRNLAREWKIKDELAAIADKITQANLAEPAEKKVDVIFLLDTSGSMKYVIDTVLQYIDLFLRKLDERNIDYALGLVSFVEQDISAFGVISDVPAFKAWLRNVVVYGGGDFPEPTLDALMAGLQEISFRSKARKIFVLYTDAPPHEKDKQGNGLADVLDVLIAKRVIVYVVSAKDNSLQKIAQETGGDWQQLPQDVRSVGYSQKEAVKFLPALDPDLEFLMQERNKRLGLPSRDVLASLTNYAYADDKKHQPKKLAEEISGMVKLLGYKIKDSLDLSPENNNNSVAEPGETVGLNLILKNTVANIDAKEVRTELKAENVDGVTIFSDQSNWGTIPAGKTVSNTGYRVKISPNFKQRGISFQLNLKGLVYASQYDFGSETIRIYVKQ